MNRKKFERRRDILFRLVELFIDDGKPVGSETLREHGFYWLSSATIRNDLSLLEQDGLVKRAHSSSGRIPTSRAYKEYAEFAMGNVVKGSYNFRMPEGCFNGGSSDISSCLHRVAEITSEIAKSAVFLSSPRFDRDSMIDIKLVGIDISRLLAVMVTNFGIVHTEVLYVSRKLSAISVKRIESYLRFRITGYDRPNLSDDEANIGARFYDELLTRYAIEYVGSGEIYRTGFANLIHFPEVVDGTALATEFSIFDDVRSIRKLLGECMERRGLVVWVGEELAQISPSPSRSCVMGVPYFVCGRAVGAIAILSSMRVPYPKYFDLLFSVSDVLSDRLTVWLSQKRVPYYVSCESSGYSGERVLCIENQK